jgi:hypothetical protein
MAEEATNIHAIKTASDGTVQIAVEKYNELLETIANQKGSIGKLSDQLSRARNEPPMINPQHVRHHKGEYMKAVRIIPADDVGAVIPIDDSELIRITLSPRGKKLIKRTAVSTGAVLGVVVAVGLNRSIKARAVARTIAEAANEVKEEVTA